MNFFSTSYPAFFFVTPTKIYCDGGVNGLDVLIEGGVFSQNEAQSSGGVIASWGNDVKVTFTGGTFANNTAK